MLATVVVCICILVSGYGLGFLFGTLYEEKELRDELVKKMTYEMDCDELKGNMSLSEKCLWLRVIDIVKYYLT